MRQGGQDVALPLSGVADRLALRQVLLPDDRVGMADRPRPLRAPEVMESDVDALSRLGLDQPGAVGGPNAALASHLAGDVAVG